MKLRLINIRTGKKIKRVVEVDNLLSVVGIRVKNEDVEMMCGVKKLKKMHG